MKKTELRSISEAYTKMYEMEGSDEPEDHKQRMINSVSEIAAIAFRIKRGDVRSEDGDRLIEIAKKIESEYKD